MARIGFQGTVTVNGAADAATIRLYDETTGNQVDNTTADGTSGEYTLADTTGTTIIAGTDYIVTAQPTSSAARPKAHGPVQPGAVVYSWTVLSSNNYNNVSPAALPYTYNYPVTVQAGDFIIICTANSTALAAGTFDVDGFTSHVQNDDQPTNDQFGIWTRVATGAESSTTISTGTGTIGSACAFMCVILRPASASNALEILDNSTWETDTDGDVAVSNTLSDRCLLFATFDRYDNVLSCDQSFTIIDSAIISSTLYMAMFYKYTHDGSTVTATASNHSDDIQAYMMEIG